MGLRMSREGIGYMLDGPKRAITSRIVLEGREIEEANESKLVRCS